MYATVRRYTGSDLAEKLASRAGEIRELIGGVSGVQAYYLIQAGGDTISVTVSEDEAGGRESSETAARWIRDNMPEVASAPPEISAGEVILSL